MVIITQSVPKESLDSRLAEFAPRQRVNSLLKKIRSIELKTKDRYLSPNDILRHIALIVDPRKFHFKQKNFVRLIYDLQVEYINFSMDRDRRSKDSIPLEEFLKEMKSWQKSA